jgi:hypothetical protein
MKSSEITRLLEADPDHEFALRPDWRTTRVVKIRGLRFRPGWHVTGEWNYDASTHPIEGHWIECADKCRTVSSIDLVTVDEALALIDANSAARRAEIARAREAERMAKRLDGMGVRASLDARGRLVIEDVQALGRVLARSEER